jgi:hypothetical protein
MFKKPKRVNFIETLKFISYFSRIFNEDLYRLMNKEEIVVVLQYFRKDKSPRPDGWPMNLYL